MNQKMNKQPRYAFYATLFDSFQQYLDSEKLWEDFYGFSADPKYSIDEWNEKCFREFTDKINRVPFVSEAASKGTAFNELIDCLIEDRKSETIEFNEDKAGRFYLVKYSERGQSFEFSFPIDLCKSFADYYEGALTQQRVEATLPTKYGDVLLYGYIDELMPFSVHDIKTTKQYSAYKFRNHFQHLVYPYCLMQNGSDARTFEYNVTNFVDIFTEVYVFDPDRDIPRLTEHCERIIEFLEANKNLIKDKKVFGIIE